jgi:hypothetical protein
MAASSHRLHFWKGFRLAGAIALLGGLLWGGALLPQREVPWNGIRELQISTEDCNRRWAEREEGPFTLPASHPRPVHWKKVSEWFRLDPGEVCAVNKVDPDSCSDQEIAPGERLTLPVRYHSPGPPSRSQNEQEGEQ